MRFTNIFCLTIYFYYTIAANIPTPELDSISVIFRHGARTTYNFYPNDPNKNLTFYPEGLGGLTNEGKMGEYQLGIFLKKFYGPFLGDIYTDKEVYVRSTNTIRTRMSAQLVLASLYKPVEPQIWNPELSWQPIPVDYKESQFEDLLQPFDNCPFAKKTMAQQENDKTVQEKFIKPHLKFYEYTRVHSGSSLKTPAELSEFFFIIKTESDMNLIIPDWVEEIYPEPLETIASDVYPYWNYSPDMKKINTGYLLKRILDDAQKKANNMTTIKINLYSGHETNVGFMLDALNVYNKPKIPGYGSALIFEFYKNSDNQFVKLKYREGPDSDVQLDLDIPDCPDYCPLKQFRQLYKNVIPDKDLSKACNKMVSWKEIFNLKQ